MKPLSGLILTAAAVTLASCSSGSSNPATTTVPTTPAGTTAAAPGTAMTVTESEFTITLPSKTLPAGTYTFTVTNKGKFAHNLTVDGAGVQDKATPSLAPGSTGDLTVTLQKASYEFYCSVDGHKDMGMDVTVQVT
ncbi:MAG TPA: plastocyanin/azurin family copper-binding protein [Propionibacteriaceae bacterium]|nr:plastocyanin/azurin family copper-binding protein [Propionibacteriaceae bacterium]